MSEPDLFDDVPPPDGMSAIIEAFPRLFRGEPPVIMGWVMPGWNALVRDLLQKSDAELTDAEALEFRVLQVKEKFGGLRFYFATGESARPRIEPLVRAAEKDSKTICDRCGKPASMRDNDGWFVTLCDEHQGDKRVTGFFGNV